MTPAGARALTQRRADCGRPRAHGRARTAQGVMGRSICNRMLCAGFKVKVRCPAPIVCAAIVDYHQW